MQFLCDYFCWIVSFNGASRVFWLSILWLILELIIRIIARKNSSFQRNSQLGESKDRGSERLIFVSIALMIVTIFSVLHNQWEPDLPIGLLPVGITLMFIGLLIRAWAVFTLGKFFTMKVIIFSNHHLVEEGPYRWLRHPSYTGIILTALGFGLASGYIMVLVAFTLLLALALGYRIYIEEKALNAEFGNEWTDYKTRTWKIIPWLF